MVTGEFCCKQLTLWQREHPDPLLAEFLRTALQELEQRRKGFVCFRARIICHFTCRRIKAGTHVASAAAHAFQRRVSELKPHHRRVACRREHPPFTTVRVSPATRTILQQFEAGEDQANAQDAGTVLPIVGRLSKHWLSAR